MRTDEATRTFPGCLHAERNGNRQDEDGGARNAAQSLLASFGELVQTGRFMDFRNHVRSWGLIFAASVLAVIISGILYFRAPPQHGELRSIASDLALLEAEARCASLESRLVSIIVELQRGFSDSFEVGTGEFLSEKEVLKAAYPFPEEIFLFNKDNPPVGIQGRHLESEKEASLTSLIQKLAALGKPVISAPLLDSGGEFEYILTAPVSPGSFVGIIFKASRAFGTSNFRISLGVELGIRDGENLVFATSGYPDVAVRGAEPRLTLKRSFLNRTLSIEAFPSASSYAGTISTGPGAARTGIISTFILLMFIIVLQINRLKARRETEMTLRELADSLEEQVRNRTIKLEKINNDLRDEIAERKRTEKALMESEARNRELFHGSIVGLFRLSIQEERMKAANRAAANIFGYPSPEKFMADFLIYDHFAEKGDQDKLRAKIAEGMDIDRYQARMTRMDGSDFWAEISAAHRAGEGFVEGVLADITELKQLEAQIESSLREKEVLLREIHHRVKNNFQVIISLLRLQSRALEDEGMRAVLRDSEGRIKSMAIVHEKLYQSRNLSRIDMRDYLGTFANDMFRTLQVSQRISLDLDVDSTPVAVDVAIPCGLIVNELMSNSLKHAFPDDATGAISIAFHHCESGKGVEYELKVGDNGIGIPPDLNVEDTDSMGMHLVHTLAVRQLRGQLEVSRDEGTEFRIKFMA